MAESALLAITGIKDVEQEGAIAASLHRSGWKVVYRATSPELLVKNLDLHPEAVLLLSDDFIDPAEVLGRNLALIRGRTPAISKIGVTFPNNDFELGELMRSIAIEEGPTHKVIPATLAKVFAITSMQGGVGVTTLAINLADQIALLGENVLLVDASSGGGIFTEHFEVHDIRNKPRELSKNFSIFEVSELAQLIYLAEIAPEFDYIIVDLGRVTEKNLSGARVLDRTFQWIIHSQGRVIVNSGGADKAIERNLQLIRNLRTAVSSIKVESVITLDLPISRRDRLKLVREKSEQNSIPISIFTRDSRNVQIAQERATTLRLSVPRSVANREIGRFISERVILK